MRAVICPAVFLLAVLIPALSLATPPALQGPVFVAGDDIVGAAPGRQETPVVVRGGNQYLAVWVDSRTNFTSLPPFIEDQGARDIYAARVDVNGNLIDAAPIVVTQEYGWQRNPAVSWNGQQWLVAWESQKPTQYYYGAGIVATRIAPDGTVLDDPPIPVVSYQSSGTAMHAVTSDGDNWLVVAQGTSAGEGGILGVRVANDGTLIDSPPQVLVPATYFLYFDISVHYAQNEYLLVYKASSALKASRFGTTLNPIGVSFDVPGLLLQSSGTNYLVVWSGASGLLGSPMAVDGTLASPAGILITADTRNETTLAWAGTTWWVAWRHPTSGPKLSRVDAAGTPLDQPGIVLDPVNGNNMYGIRVGGGSTGDVQVVWQDRRYSGLTPEDIRGAHVDATGSPATGVVVATGGPAQLLSALVPGDNGFLSVFRSEVSGTTVIKAQTLDDFGNSLMPEPVVVASGQNLGNPAVAWNGSVYLVTWSENGNILGARLQGDGTVIDGAPLSIMPGGSPAVAALGDVFLVVGTNQTYSIEFVHPFAMRVDGTTGMTLDPQPIILGQYFAKVPRVIAFGNRWLAVWQRNVSHDDTIASIRAAFVEADGSTQGEMATILGGGIHPDVAASGSVALLVWRTGTVATADNDIRALRMAPDGSLPDGAGGITISAEYDKQLSPEVAWDGAQFIVVWDDLRNSERFYDDRTDVYGARVGEDGVVIDPSGFPVVLATTPATFPEIASANGHTLIAASIFRDAGPSSAYRLGHLYTSGTATNPPQAAFSAVPTSGCPGVSVAFQDESVGDISTWLWSFGDGATSADQHPTHSYASAGEYTVTLTVGGASGSATRVEAGYITVLDPTVASFTADVTGGCSPMDVTFNSTSTGANSWLWDFGDGGTSGQESPAHTYATPGTYTVSLTVTGSCGQNTLTRTNYINITGPCAVEVHALSDIAVAGTVTGGYLDTYAHDFTSEIITEVESSGKPANRYSYLEHRWNFDVPPGVDVSCRIDAYRPSGIDDDFRVEYSLDNANFIPLVDLDRAGFFNVDVPMPPSVSGVVYLRVVDTDRTPGNLGLDVVYLDRLMIASTPGVAVPDTIFVAGIDVNREQAGGRRYRGVAVVTVHDAFGAPAAGVMVEARFTGPSNETVSATTDGAGRAPLVSSAVRTPSGAWCLEVLSLQRGTDVYYPGSNAETSDCEATSAREKEPDVQLSQNWPNPFNPITTIHFSIPAESAVRIDVFNVRGQRVVTLVNRVMPAGDHAVDWDGSRLASGVYLYRLSAGNRVVTRRMMLIK